MCYINVDLIKTLRKNKNLSQKELLSQDFTGLVASFDWFDFIFSMEKRLSLTREKHGKRRINRGNRIRCDVLSYVFIVALIGGVYGGYYY